MSNEDSKATTIEEVLVAYKIGKISLEEAVLFIKVLTKKQYGEEKEKRANYMGTHI